MQKFYLSFGASSPFAHYLLEVEAPSEHDVRLWASNFLQSVLWCGTYTEAELPDLKARWGYEVIKVAKMCLPGHWTYPSPTPHAHLDSGEHEVR